MSKHTPGPWTAATIEGDDYTFVEPTDNSPDNDNANYVIARCSGPDRVENALLIAAAPDLLAALHEISRCCDERASFDGDPAMKRWCKATSEVARAAIAKAEGAS